MLAVSLALLFAASGVAGAQSLKPLEAWVDPFWGTTPSQGNAPTYIDDPDKPFRTLQQAIDTLHEGLRKLYHSTNNPDQQAIVYALPGLYGPHGPNSSNEPLPIKMRDRVHVQGLGARRCVIRGINDAPNHVGLFWPSTSSGAIGSSYDAQVLVTYELSHPLSTYPMPPGPTTAAPWLIAPCGGDTAEVLDGFTFQGGDVQVLVWPSDQVTTSGLSGRISNCIFDLRHRAWMPDPSDPNGSGGVAPIFLDGPWFGIMMIKPFTVIDATQPGGYYDQQFLIAHNTFLFARWGRTDPLSTGQGWFTDYARKPCVAIVDVTDPRCGSTTGNADPDNSLRGLGRPGILGNVFRTGPTANHQALLGISHTDVTFLVNGVPVLTNAFDFQLSNRGNVLNTCSMPVDNPQSFANTCGLLYNTHSTPASSNACPNPSSLPVFTNWPTPVWEIWSGATGGPPGGFDPCFVGEYLSVTYAPLWNQVDLRVLPGSPCEDLGFPIASVNDMPRYVTTLAGATFDTAVLADLSLFSKWDGEHWGNPRWVDSDAASGVSGTDIGFDESQLMVMSGSWANDSASHNKNGFLHPSVPDGLPDRHLIFPLNAAGYSLLGRDVTVFQKMEIPVYTPPTPPVLHGWINPPQSLRPPAGPFGGPTTPWSYRWKYILFDGQGPTGFPGTWAFTMPGATTHTPLGGGAPPTVSFYDATISDDECPGGVCTYSYFNTQAVLLDTFGSPTPTPLSSQIRLRGNMQSEYR